MEDLEKANEIFKKLATAGLEERYGKTEGKAIAFLLFGGFHYPGLVGIAELTARGAFAEDPHGVAKEFTKDAAASLAIDTAKFVLTIALQKAGISLVEYSRSLNFLSTLLSPTEMGNAELPRSMKDIGLHKGEKPSLVPGGPRNIPGVPVPKPSPSTPVPTPAPTPAAPRPQPAPPPSEPEPGHDPFPTRPDNPFGPRPSAPDPAPRPEPRPKPEAPPTPPPRPEAPPKPPPKPDPAPPAPPAPDDPPFPNPPLTRNQGEIDVRPELSENRLRGSKKDGGLNN